MLICSGCGNKLTNRKAYFLSKWLTDTKKNVTFRGKIVVCKNCYRKKINCSPKYNFVSE
jgi:hypothetical protein